MAADSTPQLKQAALAAAPVLVYPLTTTEQFGESMERPQLSWMAMCAFHGVPNATRDPRVDLDTHRRPRAAS